MTTTVTTDYQYPTTYAPLTLITACYRLKLHFPFHIRIESAMRAAMNIGRRPDAAESNFAILHWQRLSSSYAEATSIILQKLREKILLDNQCMEAISARKIRENDRTKQFMEEIWNEQGKNDVVFIGAHLGLRHAGRAIAEVKNNCDDNEFPLDLFSVACILLQCPDRAKRSQNNLWIDCAGSELQSDTKRFNETPTFRFDLLCPRLFAEATEDGPFARTGTATGFVPNYVVNPPQP